MAAVAVAVVAAVAITGYSVWKLLVAGILSWHVTQPEFYAMAAELLVVWLLLFLLFFYGRDDRIRIAGAAVIIAAAAWLHVVFLPMVFAGLYAVYLTGVGYFLSRKVLRRNMGAAWNFMIGVAVTLTVFCLLSLNGYGSIIGLRFWVVESGLLLAVWRVAGWGWGGSALSSNAPGGSGGRQQAVRTGDGKTAARRWNHPVSAMTAVMLSAILTLLLLQMGRMNGAVDFDSIWYGVRSDVMLNSGDGIYENLGTLGVVYTYPKGWETLTLPLSGLLSYSFPIAFNIWAAAFVLIAAYETAKIRMKSGSALWVPFLMAAVPGIMNMSITAKADIMTLFFQILMVQGMMRYEKDRRPEWLIMGLASGGVSLTMKPTAVIFSTAIAGMGIVWLVWDRFVTGARQVNGAGDESQGPRRRMTRRRGLGRELLVLIPAAASLAGIWGRTLLLVGVPVTSVFYQVFQKLGFRVKYPFYASGFPSAGNELSWTEKIRFFLGRLYGVLLNPQGDDMGHVIIAWGTVIPVVLLIFWLAGKVGLMGKTEPVKNAGLDGNTRWRTPQFLPLLLCAVLFINLVSLYSLYQIDGNYYILFYFLVILTGCIALERMGGRVWKAARAGLIPAWIFAVVLCCLTNWAWALGMGGIHPVNKGYYNHVEAEREKRTVQGSGAIWDILASDPKNRVIALGEHPGVLTFPCSVQSYVDVSGYWGNPEVVSTAPDFLRYLQYAGTDYLYMEKEYVDTSVRIYQIVRQLVKEGWLTDVRDENGNLILTVEKGSPDTERTEENLDVFDNRYIQHP